MLYRVLGPLEVRDGEQSLPLAGAKQRALLALLLLHANHVLSRDRLIDELWGDEPPATAVPSLQVYVSRLRKLLPDGALATRPPGYLLEVEPDDLDLRCFERLLAEGHEALAAGDAGRAARVLHEALALWRGPALAEFAFEPFAQAEIGRLEDLRLAAVEERIEADLALGRHADLIGELEALIAENPHRERLRGQLMLALYRSGRQTEALAAYQAARHALVDELGIEPSEHLQRLEKAILTHDASLETRAPPTASAAPDTLRAAPVERKLVTVLFADLVMTNELEEDPERAEAFLERAHREAETEIEAAGGSAEKGIAGALLATFGATAARHADHAVRAVSAALATRNRLSDTFGDALSLRMGVESGEVILGRPGLFVSGMPVAAAARLIRTAQAAEIIVGERAATATAGTFQLEQRDGAYVVVAPLAPTRSPAETARRRRRRRLVLAGTAILAIVAVAALLALATRQTPLTAPPNSAAIIDAKTNEVVDVVPVGAMPRAIAVGLRAVWVANDDKTLSRINRRTHELEKTIPLEATATGVAVGDDAVWIAYGYLGGVSRLDPDYNSVSSSVLLPINRQHHSARGSVTFGDRAVWVAYGDSSIFRIDPKSMRFEGPFSAGSQPSAMAFGLGSLWIANTQDASVTRFDTATNGATVGPITVGASPDGLTVAAGAVWVANSADDAVSRIDAAITPSTVSSVGELIPVGRKPVGIAYGAGSVWVANQGDGTVSRIDPQTNQVLATIHVGNAPSAIAVGGGAVWVTVQPAAIST
jgi:YVTN family beta-propeller protein